MLKSKDCFLQWSGFDILIWGTDINLFTKAPNGSAHVTRVLTARGIVILTIYILIECLEKSLLLVGRDKLILWMLVHLKKLSSDLAQKK